MDAAKEIALNPPACVRGEGDDSWVERAFRDHHSRVLALLTRLTGDRAAAEDIAGEVFFKLSRQPSLSKQPDTVPAWLYRVATNAGLDAVRARLRRRRREAPAEQGPAAIPAGSDALSEMLREERRQRVRAVLAGLKPRDARLLLLRSGGVSYVEIARAVGVGPGSVGTLLARAEAEFERRYRARYGDEP